MEFLYPGFLFALAALALPIIIHLFNFRRFVKVPFTNVKFLKEIKYQTQNQNRLKHLLVLLMRLLAITFLVFAFAQPFVPEEEGATKEMGNSVSIFIDNSFSMEGESEAGNMLEVAKNRAIDIAQAYANTDRFQLLTHDFEGKHQRLVGKTEFIELVEDVEISSRSRSLSEILNRQSDLLKKNVASNELSSYIISDYQKSNYNFSRAEIDTSINLSLVLFERNNPSNLFIDSAWFESPVRKINEQERLMVRIVNTGSDAVKDVPLKLEVNGQQTALGSFGVDGNSAADTALYFVHDNPGIKRLSLSIDDYPITYDDKYYLSYQVFESIDILAIQGQQANEERILANVFKGDSGFAYNAVSVNRVDYSGLQEANLIILNELEEISSGLTSALASFVTNGGSLWVIPGEFIDLASYNALLAELQGGAIIGAIEGDFSVRQLNTEHPLYAGIFRKIPRNIDLPSAQRYYKLSRDLSGRADELMTFGNGDAFLTDYTVENGNFYLLSVPLTSEKNNFSRHALFVATTLRMAELSRSSAIQAVELGGITSITGITLPNEAVFHLVDKERNIDVIPNFSLRGGRVEIDPGPGIREAGNYDLLLNEELIAAIGINYSRSESQPVSYTREELESEVAGFPGNAVKIFEGTSSNLAQTIEQARIGTELWKICLILVLVFLLVETLLLRIRKISKA